MGINLWVAAADNNIDVVKEHLDSGSYNANSKDPNGYTALHAAASYGHKDLLKLLVERGGDINIQDGEGDTPLHHTEDVETAKFLVEELKADTTITNNDGLTAAAYIEEEDEFPELAVYLKLLIHGLLGEEKSTAVEESSSIPTFEGNEIKFAVETEEDADAQLSPEELEERRKKLEGILNGENPEEALRELIQLAVHEGLANFKAEEDEKLQADLQTASKRLKQ
ncbi:uncharacterized protein KQ657_001568 [Scheffersomyces spartinae]|uniref:Ankyrin repeat-containing protein n=1 Tax=Scheffersomyces spartinae TaxID=45513 RepID=A0A9P7V7H0_9ASCO|nr:uncharacterized protein KQ657_001568 [Scheffersomyces spartinae]KAG7192785.1 hypothetical protein KQ657_001568 [Scheffersomyces spartinae]